MSVNNSSRRVMHIGIILLICLIWFNTQPASAQINPSIPEDIKKVQMTDKTINTTILAEAIPSIELRMGGGSYPGCLTIPEQPVVNYHTDNMDMTGAAYFSTCGWAKDETIKITLRDPQGVFYTYETKATSSRNVKNLYQMDFYFQPGVDAREGKYRFTLQGSAQRDTEVVLKTHVFFNLTDGPRLYAVPKNRFEPVLKTMGGQHQLRLNGFLENEWVRLLVYRFENNQMLFYGWQDFYTDSSGRLLVEVDLPKIDEKTELNFYAYGQETHTVHMERFSAEGLRINRQFTMDLYCPGALTPRLTGFDQARAAEGVETVTIYQQPGFGSRVISNAPVDTELKVYDYPKCIDHAYWWKVYVAKSLLFGWVPESFLGKYRTEPVE